MFWKKLLQWRHLAEIFIFIKMISHVSFISLVHQIVIMSLLISIKLTITKIHHLIWLRFGRSEHKKSQCVLELSHFFFIHFHFQTMCRGTLKHVSLSFFGLIEWQCRAENMAIWINERILFKPLRENNARE